MQCTLAEAQGLINWAKTSGDDDNEERINRGNDWLNMQSSLAGFDSRCFAGNKTGGGGGKKDAKKEEDKKIDENGNMDNKGEKGVIVSMINGSAAFGLGPTADIGLVTDSQKKSFYYLTFGYVVGLGASAGTGVTITNKYFKGIDIKGESVGFNITFPFFKGLFSGDGFFSSKITHGIGLNIGVGKGYFIPHTYTIIAPLPAFNDKNIYFSTYGH